MGIDLNPSEPAFPIGVAAKLTGLSQKQLRLLEAKQIVMPLRTEHYRRLYSLEQLNYLRYAAYLIIRRGVNAAGIRVAFELIDTLPEDKRTRVLRQADQALKGGTLPDLGPLLGTEQGPSPPETDPPPPADSASRDAEE